MSGHQERPMSVNAQTVKLHTGKKKMQTLKTRHYHERKCFCGERWVVVSDSLPKLLLEKFDTAYDKSMHFLFDCPLNPNKGVRL